MSIKTILESLYGNETMFEYDTEYDVDVYINPEPSEILSVCRNDQGMDGCRIGIDDDDNVYIWIDTMMHDDVEDTFGLHFGDRKFIYPKPGSKEIYVSSSQSEREFKKIPEKTVRHMMSFFKGAKEIKLDRPGDEKPLFSM